MGLKDDINTLKFRLKPILSFVFDQGKRFEPN